MKHNQWGIWVEDIGWLVEKYTKNPKTSTYTAHPSLWTTAAAAKKEATSFNTMWRGRKQVYSHKKYKASRPKTKTKRS